MEKEKDDKAFKDFKNQTLHREVKRNFKATNSYGSYDIYKHIRKNKWYNIGRSLTEHEFYLMIRTVNKLLAQELLNGNTVTFPYKMGSLELRKATCEARMKDGKLKVTYPVDWDSTLRLWYRDEEARNSKILVRYDDGTVYRVMYIKTNAYYTNKGFYQFSLTRKIKEAIKEKVRKGELDTLYDKY